MKAALLVCTVAGSGCGRLGFADLTDAVPLAADAHVPIAGLFGATYLEQTTFSSPVSLVFSDVIATSDGGLALCGYGPQNGTSSAARVGKLGADGSLQWMVAVQENVATFGSRVRQLADGSFAAFSAGPTVSNGTTILTVDATGNLTGWHASTVAGEVTDLGADGTFVTAGNVTGAMTDGTVSLVDGTESIVWSKTYATANDDAVFDARLLANGTAVAVGYFDQSSNSPLQSTVLGLAADGSIAWQQSFADTTGSIDAQLTSIAPTGDGGFYVLGLKVAPDDSTTTVLGKLSADGSIEWMNDVAMGTPGAGRGLRIDGGMTVLAGGDVIVVGSYNLDANFGDPENYFRVAVARFHADGAPLWMQLYDTNVDPSPTQRWHAIGQSARELADGAVLVSGVNNNFSDGGHQPWLLEIDPYDGVLDPISTSMPLVVAPSTLVPTAPVAITVSDTGAAFSPPVSATPADWDAWLQYDSVDRLTP